jgi:predicted dehydrogenase
VRVGVVGLGDRGGTHIQSFLPLASLRVAGVCDVRRSKAEHWKRQVDNAYKTRDCLAVQDVRELIARPDIDALFVCSPENWHALHGVWAMRAGKDVYGEKGLSLTVREGRKLVDTARATGPGVPDRHPAAFAGPVPAGGGNGAQRLPRPADRRAGQRPRRPEQL